MTCARWLRSQIWQHSCDQIHLSQLLNRASLTLGCGRCPLTSHYLHHMLEHFIPFYPSTKRIHSTWSPASFKGPRQQQVCIPQICQRRRQLCCTLAWLCRQSMRRQSRIWMCLLDAPPVEAKHPAGNHTAQRPIYLMDRSACSAWLADQAGQHWSGVIISGMSSCLPSSMHSRCDRNTG